MSTHQASKQLYYLRLRVPREEAYFVYFTFEANEGLCYYSTADESIGGLYRDIDVYGPIEAQAPLKDLIKLLQTEVRLDILSEKIIQDV